VHKFKQIEKYLFDFFSNRFEDFDNFYRTTHRDRNVQNYGIYALKDGNKLMDFLNSIHGNIEDQFYFEMKIKNIWILTLRVKILLTL